MIQFLIITGIILVSGPGHNGGFKSIEEKGPKAALEQAWEERKDAPITQDLYKAQYND